MKLFSNIVDAVSNVRSMASFVAIAIVATACSKPASEPYSWEALMAVQEELLALRCLPPDLRAAADRIRHAEPESFDSFDFKSMIVIGRNYVASYKAAESAGAYRDGCPIPLPDGVITAEQMASNRDSSLVVDYREVNEAVSDQSNALYKNVYFDGQFRGSGSVGSESYMVVRLAGNATPDTWHVFFPDGLAETVKKLQIARSLSIICTIRSLDSLPQCDLREMTISDAAQQ